MFSTLSLDLECFFSCPYSFVKLLVSKLEITISVWETTPIMSLHLELSPKLQTQHLCFRCLGATSYLRCPGWTSLSTCHPCAPVVFPISADGNSNLQVAYTKNSAVILDFFYVLYPFYIRKSCIQTITTSLHCFKLPPLLGYWNCPLTGLSLLPPYCLFSTVQPKWLGFVLFFKNISIYL